MLKSTFEERKRNFKNRISFSAVWIINTVTNTVKNNYPLIHGVKLRQSYIYKAPLLAYIAIDKAGHIF